MISVARWSPWLSSPTGRFSRSTQPAHVGKIGDPRADLGVGLARDPRPQPIARRHLDRNAQILPHRQLGKNLGDLKGAGDAPPDAPRRQEARDILVVEQDPARGRGQKPADQVEEGGLAGAIGADHRAQLAGLDRHRDVADGNETAEMARDAFDLEQAHDADLRWMRPRTPRGKNSTTSTKNNPINDIQFAVSLET